MAKRYTDAEKAEALAMYAEEGPTAVQQALGIPKGTVTRWAQAAGTETRFIENMANQVKVSRLKWEERRMDLAHDIGETAELALAVTQTKLADGSCSAAQHAATTMAILVDKAQLLTGASTSRHEHVAVDAIDAEIARLEAKLHEAA